MHIFKSGIQSLTLDSGSVPIRVFQIFMFKFCSAFSGKQALVPGC